MEESTVVRTNKKKKVILWCVLAGVLIIALVVAVYVMRFRFLTVEGEYIHLQYDAKVIFEAYPDNKNAGTYVSESEEIELANTTGKWQYSNGKLLVANDTMAEMYQLMTDITGEDYGYDGTVYIYDKGCFISLESCYSGEIPDGDTFDVTYTSQNGDKIIFCSDGTVKKDSNDSSHYGTYSREGDIITISLDGISMTQSYLIYKDGIYFDVYKKNNGK